MRHKISMFDNGKMYPLKLQNYISTHHTVAGMPYNNDRIVLIAGKLEVTNHNIYLWLGS